MGRFDLFKYDVGRFRGPYLFCRGAALRPSSAGILEVSSRPYTYTRGNLRPVGAERTGPAEAASTVVYLFGDRQKTKDTGRRRRPRDTCLSRCAFAKLGF